MTVDSRIIEILNKIEFTKNYKALVDTFNSGNMEHHSVDEVKSIFNDLGYTVTYNKKEDFYKLEVVNNTLTIQTNFSLKFGSVEIILGILLDGERIKVGGPFGFLYRKLTSERISKPLYDNYGDLKQIFTKAISISLEIEKELSELK